MWAIYVFIQELTTACSAINQQIALKTINKLGFTVQAVWNGKEALDYLQAADEAPTADKPKPDIILMDVQMPIIDGYKATHLIRHHSPYKFSARNVPIVAMTASAIQGDREKCKKAGMDDYLAKPVKQKTLENMLVRWALNRRVTRMPGEGEIDDSDCSEPGEHNCGSAAVPIFGMGDPHNASEIEVTSPGSEAQRQERKSMRPTMRGRQNSRALTLPGVESEGDRAERREELEEMATALRDDKLVEAAGPPAVKLVHDGRDKGQKLTIENVGKLEREVSSSQKSLSPRKQESCVGSAESVGEMTKDEGSSDTFGSEPDGEDVRPQVERRWRDSERTIRGPEA